jgi:hypothetical protein
LAGRTQHLSGDNDRRPAGPFCADVKAASHCSSFFLF